MDESDEYLHQTISSHFRIILSYIETLSSLSFAQNLDLEYLESSIMNLVMKPSTSIFLVSIILLLFFTQTFDFWLAFYNRLPFKSITRNLRSGLGGSHFKNVIYELKANQVGIYAIQGRGLKSLKSSKSSSDFRYFKEFKVIFRNDFWFCY